ncbi:hypothetical protein C5167_040321 [Papaver somniferum]|uniref:Uncharacterized protein n=1 Tax=Papaver somniferum TaxID=3469 RepID=A0A4Y7IH29_PAPSO|nr:hypothetical protein C5167_040321 [Papaver somniferum]
MNGLLISGIGHLANIYQEEGNIFNLHIMPVRFLRLQCLKGWESEETICNPNLEAYVALEPCDMQIAKP